MVRVTEVLLELHLQEQHVSIHLQINADGGFFKTMTTSYILRTLLHFNLKKIFLANAKWCVHKQTAFYIHNYMYGQSDNFFT